MIMTEDEKIKRLFNSLNMQQKYAYSATIETFLAYVRDDVVLSGLSSLYELNIKALDVDPEDALDLFEKPGQLLSPIDYLKTIHDKAILSSLLFTCRIIVSQACGEIDGQNCRDAAEEHFMDWFHDQLGFSNREIEEIINNINRFNPFNS